MFACVVFSPTRHAAAAVECLGMVASSDSHQPAHRVVLGGWVPHLALDLTRGSTSCPRHSPCAMSLSRLYATPQCRRRSSLPSCDAAVTLQRWRHADASLFSTHRPVQTLEAEWSTGDYWVCWSTRPMSAWRSCAAAHSRASRVTWHHTPACVKRCPWSAGSQQPGVQAHSDVDHRGRPSPRQVSHSTSVCPPTCTVKHKAHHQHYLPSHQWPSAR